jgi:miniconductance mechanosensitive channel
MFVIFRYICNDTSKVAISNQKIFSVMSLLYDFIKDLFLKSDVYLKLATYGAALCTFVILVLFSMILFIIVRLVLVKIVSRVVKHTRGIWDNVLYSHKVFHVLAHFVPAIIIYTSSGFAGDELTWLPAFIVGIARIYILAVFMVASVRFLNSVQDIYNTYPYAIDRPIKGYIQLAKVLIYFTGGIFILAVLMEQNPWTLFAGLGAMAAVLVFVFRDPILGFVASIQLAANKMVKPGDWITVPKFNIDGTVVDISLTTVKIQNWDKTITTIPTYSLVSESVTNWIGMMESGVRRIQRTINIDMTSIRICDEILMDKLRRAPHLKNIISPGKSDKVDIQGKGIEQGMILDASEKRTNLSLFKEYLEKYCALHPGIQANMSRMVRFLQSNEKGLPIEITVFSKYQQVDVYESLQAEIVDHILAALPEFELRIFQNPSGNYFQYSGDDK